MSIKLVVGLGNPGKEYLDTRHNMGFKLIDMLAEDLNNVRYKDDFNAKYAKFELEGQQFYIMKPMTYMNLSGQAVVPFCKYFKIDPSEIIVLCDDLALEPGRFRMRMNGSSGGQKGLKNIIDLFNTQEIKRIRIGIGEPHGANIVDYVLGVPDKDEQVKIANALDAALFALKYALVSQDFLKTMSRFNTNQIL